MEKTFEYETKKYEVQFDGRKFHLTSYGKRTTFCGEQISRPKWSVSQPATLQEFVNNVRPRCGSCKASAVISITIEQAVGGFEPEEQET